MDKSKWEYKKLGEVSFYPRKRLEKEFLSVGNYVGVENLLKDKKGRVDAEDLPANNTPTIEYMANDILIGNIRPYLRKIWLADKKGGASGDVIVVRINEDYSELLFPKYLYLVLSDNSFFDYDMAHSKGAKMPRGDKDAVLKYTIPIPSYADQQRIVAELDCLNEMIAVKQEQLKEFDKLAQSIFYDMFGDLSLNNKGWPKKPFTEIAVAKTGITYKPDNVKDSGIIVLRSSNVQDDELAFEDVVRVDLPISEKYHVQNGDILMCSRNGSARLVGKTARIRNVNEIMTWGAFMTIIRSQYNDYLLHYFKTDTFRDSLSSSKTTTVHQITIGMLNALNIPLPPLSLQQQFAEKISAIEAQKELVKQSIAETQHLLDYTMEKYFGYD